jgi:hypothetical protein
MIAPPAAAEPDPTACRPGVDSPASTVPWQVALRWSMVALLPFWSLFLAHYVRGPHLPSGFICYDLGYYAANGREIFERGNGLGYCNPYDTSPDAPVIYYHWLPWLLGFGIKVLGLDPGSWFFAVGLLAGLVFALGTFRLVEAILPSARFKPGLFLLSMWGGGLCVLTAVACNLVFGLPPDFRLLRFDPFEGLWFLCWGRNCLYATEATYHALIAWAWVGIVRGKPWQGVACIAALAATHPFSGAQHLAILGVWLSIRLLWDRRFLGPWLATAAASAAFASYYFHYLPRFPEHQRIFSDWSLMWILPVASMAAAYTPVAALATARCWLDRARWRSEMTFFVVAAAVSLFLVKHELFMPARQPLHFTRGYVWMPLALLGLPLLQQILIASADRLSRPAMTAVAAAGMLLMSIDSATWLGFMCRESREELRTTSAVFDLLRQLDSLGARGVGLVLCGEAADDNYLLGTYTALDPYIGHLFLCPDRNARLAAASRWLQTGVKDPALNVVDVVILSKLRRYPIDFTGWEILCENDRLAALRRWR